MGVPDHMIGSTMQENSYVWQPNVNKVCLELLVFLSTTTYWTQ